ncbi:MAG: hypothetical protein P8L85_21450 [Rubripirellula sp.]|nr:hypothetical protein [Rubripirellula sp.]
MRDRVWLLRDEGTGGGRVSMNFAVVIARAFGETFAFFAGSPS